VFLNKNSVSTKTGSGGTWDAFEEFGVGVGRNKNVRRSVTEAGEKKKMQAACQASEARGSGEGTIANFLVRFGLSVGGRGRLVFTTRGGREKWKNLSSL